MKPKVQLLMDSGAVSAYYVGAEIKIDDYAAFILANREHIWLPINLDVLNMADPEKGASESWVNYCYLLDRGIPNLPVYHEREHIKWLDRLLTTTDFVGISNQISTGDKAKKDQQNWYDIVWNHITDSKGRPIGRYHGLGDTSPASLNRYPWHTLDSTTWYLSGAMAGTVILDGRRYQAKTKVIRNKYFLSMDSPKPQLDAVMAKFKSWGINGEMFMTTELSSDEMNIFRCFCTAAYILELIEQSKDRTTFDCPPCLVTEKSKAEGNPREGPAELYFVISGSTAKRAIPILTKFGITKVLLSYHYCTPRVWNEDIIPWLYDPVGSCESNPRLKPYWELIERFSI